MNSPGIILHELAELETWAASFPLPPLIIRRIHLAKGILHDALADAGLVPPEPSDAPT